MLLILSSEEDFAVDYLIVKLIEEDLPYFRINSESLVKNNASIRLGDKTEIKQISMEGDQHLNLDDVTAVWYRRSIQPIPSLELSKPQRIFIAGEYKNFWNGLLLGTDVLWVSPPHYVQLAEHKVLQLQLAKKLGFKIPETLISKSPQELRDFVGQMDSVICKPIYHGRYIDETGQHAVYTRRVNLEDLENDVELQACPVFLQSEVQRKADLRVTFIGNECFVARILSKDKNLIDWRKPEADIFYEVGSIPDETFNKCKRMMSLWDLHYAAFDFIEDPNGQWIFLEVNPVGEWAWLEDYLGFEMRKAFIKLFYGDRA